MGEGDIGSLNLYAFNRVILYFNITFGRELVVLLTKLSMFGKFFVHAWR
jgi:hypothetical protein